MIYKNPGKWILQVLIFFLPFTNALSQSNFSKADSIISQIKKTSFPSDTFDITDYGARGNGSFDNKPAIMKAVSECSEKGGGVVLVPAGIYYCKGPVSLRSNVNLHLDEGSTILFSPDPADYLPAVFTRWEGVEIYNYSPMIYTKGQENVGITGQGTLDGNSERTWVDFRKRQGDAQKRLREANEKGTAVSDRRFGEGDFLRPSFVQFIDCRRILVEGITLKHSPLWILHPVYCSDITIRNVIFNSLVINNDGIDIDSSCKGLIEGCTFSTGDDAVVFKSGRDSDGWRVNRSSHDFVVRDCTAPRVLHGIAFGSEMSGGVENIYIENIRLGRVRGEAMQFKANKDRGGYIRNIYIRNVDVDSCGNHLFFFTNSYHSYRGGNAPSDFHEIHLSNVHCRKTNYVLQVQGLEETPIHDISIRNVAVEHAENIFDKMEFYHDVELKQVFVKGHPLKIQSL